MTQENPDKPSYPIYGGPLDGQETEDAAVVYAYRRVTKPPVSRDVPGEIGKGSNYAYHLYDIGAGMKAFLPRDDDDLLEAYHQAGGDVGDPATEALMGEIERRKHDR
jgi:hypothetical protein